MCKISRLNGVSVTQLFFLLNVLFLLNSCVSYKELTKKAKYFDNINDSILNKVNSDIEPIFQKGDILSISVITPNELSAKLFNQPSYPGGSSNVSEGQQSIVQSGSGYLVDEKGNIVFPYLGKIHAEGLTRSSLTDSISEKLRNYVDSPIISIKLQNYRITILGEVARPGTFSIPSERVTVLDAIGLAGDLTIYGKRNNIRVIRLVNGVRESGTIDLNKGDIFDSQFFYLRQNDIVYVEMNERKIPNTDQASLRNVSIAIGVISALGVIASIINVLK